MQKILGLLLLGTLIGVRSIAAQGVGEVSSNDSLEEHSWRVVREFPQKSFPKTVPAGNYSGITHLHDDIYAVVSDKSDTALYYNFRILVNRKTGELENVENLGYSVYTDGSRVNPAVRFVPKETGFDHEAIAKVSDSTLVVASEGKFRLKEFLNDGASLPSEEEAASYEGALQSSRLWEWDVPASDYYPNYVYESLTYDSIRHRLWTISESTMRKDGEPAAPQNGLANKLRLIGFDWKPQSSLHPIVSTFTYQMDKPSTQKIAETYVMGVSELCALPDGQLLVLEREAFIPKLKVGSFCHCKLYLVNPNQESVGIMPKRLLTEWNTTLTIFGRSFANYEGMCLGPQLADGSQVLILLSDSQNQYAGVLKDWFRTIVLK